MSSNVEFEEDSFGKSFTGASSPYKQPTVGGYAPQAGYGYGGGEVTGFAGWLMRHGLTKSPEGAQKFQVGIIIINIIITAIVVIFFL